MNLIGDTVTTRVNCNVTQYSRHEKPSCRLDIVLRYYASGIHKYSRNITFNSLNGTLYGHAIWQPLC